MCFKLATEFPSLRFVVQDFDSVLDEGRSKVPAAISDRVTFMAHDFLTEQPVKGADVYFFRWILHNWSDEYSVRILRALIPALEPGAHVVIMDTCLPEPGVLPVWPEKLVR